MSKLPAVCALLLVAACGGNSATTLPRATKPATKPSAKPSPKPVVTHAPRFAVTTSATAQEFTIPDGSIGCDVESAYARCDQVHRDWALPPPPADCSSGWGHGIEMQLGSRASVFCGSDSVLGGRVLAPGHGIKVGFVECDVVTATQVLCSSSSDGHGFTVTRKAYSLR